MDEAVNRSIPLRLAAASNAAIALLHLAIIFLGAPAYRYFGAADMATLAERGSAVPALVTAGLTVVFVVFALYAWSGAGSMRRLPLLGLGLWAIGVIYTLRGLILILDIQRWMRGLHYPPRQTVFSLVALVIGVLYLVGAWRRGRRTAG
jgi:hypothetical protein